MSSKNELAGEERQSGHGINTVSSMLKNVTNQFLTKALLFEIEMDKNGVMYVSASGSEYQTGVDSDSTENRTGWIVEPGQEYPLFNEKRIFNISAPSFQLSTKLPYEAEIGKHFLTIPQHYNDLIKRMIAAANKLVALNNHSYIWEGMQELIDDFFVGISRGMRTSTIAVDITISGLSTPLRYVFLCNVRLVDIIVAAAKKFVCKDGSFIWEDVLSESGDISSFMRSSRCSELVRKLDARGSTIAHAIASSDLTPQDASSFLHYLVEHGLQNLLLIPNEEGDTPLHIAIKRDRRGLVAALLQYLPDIALHIPNRQGKTPLLYLALFKERYRDLFYKNFAETPEDAGLLLQQFLLHGGDPKFLFTGLGQEFHSDIRSMPSSKIISYERLQHSHSLHLKITFDLEVGSALAGLEEVDVIVKGNRYPQCRRARHLRKTAVKQFQTTTSYVKGQGALKMILNEEVIHKLTMLKLRSGYSASEESGECDIYGSSFRKQPLSKSKRIAKKEYLHLRKQKIEYERSNYSD